MSSQDDGMIILEIDEQMVNARRRVTAVCNGQPLHLDTIDIANHQRRQGFIRTVEQIAQGQACHLMQLHSKQRSFNTRTRNFLTFLNRMQIVLLMTLSRQQCLRLLVWPCSVRVTTFRLCFGRRTLAKLRESRARPTGSPPRFCRSLAIRRRIDCGSARPMNSHRCAHSVNRFSGQLR